jgi:zinc protease
VLELLADMTQHASFSTEDFRRERQQLISLLESRQGSARIKANQMLSTTLYGSHPLSRQPEGTVESLQTLTYDELRSIYRRAFAPQNLIFSIVSPYPHNELTAQLEDLLPGRGSPTAALPTLPATEKTQRVTANLGGEMTAIRMGALFPAEADDAKALEIVVGVLSDRLAMDLRESRGLSYSVGASVVSHEETSAFTAWLNPPRERTREGEQALAQFIAEFDAATITPEELGKIRSAKVGRWMMRLLSSMSQAYYLAMAELDGNVARYGQMLEGYDDLTLDDLQRTWRTYLAAQPLVTVVVD